MNVESLKSDSEYQLLASIKHTEIKAFIKEELFNKTPLLVATSIVQMGSLGMLLLLFGYAFIINLKTGNFQPLLRMGFAAVLSFSVLILVHELIHVLGFKILGKRDIRIGGSWKKFVFYAAGHLQILTKNELAFIAVLPFVSILLLGATSFLWSSIPWALFFWSVVTLIHNLFCVGDALIVSFMFRHKGTMLTYDDCDARISYFYCKNCPQ